jgi:hypothetical protein
MYIKLIDGDKVIDGYIIFYITYNLLLDIVNEGCISLITDLHK